MARSADLFSTRLMNSVFSDKQRLWKKIVEESIARVLAKMQMLSHFERAVVNLVQRFILQEAH
jgi:hypothetical protein